MDKVTLNFEADNLELTSEDCPFTLASNTVAYIEAVFDLGDNWSGFDSVRAVWFTAYSCISTVLDSNNTCVVPTEVLTKPRKVFVNLVGSIISNDEVTDRLTTYPMHAITVDAEARITGTETAEVTASQFEQFVSQVAQYASDAEDAKEDAEAALNELLTRPLYPSDGQ